MGSKFRWLLPLFFAMPLVAQDTTAVWHPCMDAIRCFIHKDSTLAQKRETATSAYILGGFVVVASNAVWGWDQDHGGYPDIVYPQKQAAHFLSAMVLTQGAIALHVKPIHAVLITTGLGVAFEFSQGHVNGHDIAADVLGSVAGALFAHWLSFR